MRADATHPEQVRAILADAAAVVTSVWERQRVERLHAEVMGLVEGEWEATKRAIDQWLEEEREGAEIGVRVPTDDDAVEV